MVKPASLPLLVTPPYHCSSASTVIGRSATPSVRTTAKSFIHFWYNGNNSRRCGPSTTFSPVMLMIGVSSGHVCVLIGSRIEQEADRRGGPSLCLPIPFKEKSH